MTRFRPFRPKKCHLRKRFGGWLDPPQECDTCGGPAVLVCNSLLYGRAIGRWPWVYFCLCCGAATGCHPQSVYPLGTMADAATRKARSAVHALLDPMWQSGGMTRNEAYARLAQLMGLPPKKAIHIGNMALEDCHLAAERLRETLMVEDFG